MIFFCILFYSFLAPLSNTLEEKPDFISLYFKIENEQCKKAGNLTFFSLTDKDCSLICKLENKILSDDDDYDYSNDIEIIAEDGYQCQNNGYCQDGECVNQTSFYDTTTFDDFITTTDVV